MELKLKLVKRGKNGEKTSISTLTGNRRKEEGGREVDDSETEDCDEGETGAAAQSRKRDSRGTAKRAKLRRKGETIQNKERSGLA